MTDKNLAQELRTELGKGIVKFTFQKKDGTIRQAEGTRDLDLVERLDVENGGAAAIIKGCDPYPGVIPYFDVEKQGWRSCREDSVISIDNTTTTIEDIISETLEA